MKMRLFHRLLKANKDPGQRTGIEWNSLFLMVDAG